MIGLFSKNCVAYSYHYLFKGFLIRNSNNTLNYYGQSFSMRCMLSTLTGISISDSWRAYIHSVGGRGQGLQHWVRSRHISVNYFLIIANCLQRWKSQRIKIHRLVYRLFLDFLIHKSILRGMVFVLKSQTFGKGLETFDLGFFSWDFKNP